ncbi:DUF6165 family protein [Luteimonas sp. A478]
MKLGSILMPMSIGELLDKITILEIKSERIADAEKRGNVMVELQGLTAIWEGLRDRHPGVEELKQQLKVANEAMWDVQDGLRDREAAKNFDEEFVRLACAVGRENAVRVGLKNDINRLVGSTFIDEKEYQADAAPGV